MDVIQPILSVASRIYSLVEKVKANRKRCRRVSARVKALEKLVRSFKKRELENSDDVSRALRELCSTLTSAEELIKKYSSFNWVERVLSSSSHGDEFNSLNERLNDAFQVLSGAEQLQQSHLLVQMFELSSRQKEDDQDRREDDEELKQRGFILHSCVHQTLMQHLDLHRRS